MLVPIVENDVHWVNVGIELIAITKKHIIINIMAGF